MSGRSLITTKMRRVCGLSCAPFPWPKMLAKLLAAKDVLGEVTGVIDTTDKFESHRWVMTNRA